MTAPFGPGLEAALKGNVQGGRLHLYKRFVVNPRFFCCVSGTSVGVAKDPVAVLVVNPQRVCINTAVNADYSRCWSPSSTIASWSVAWGDGQTSNGVWPGAGNVNHPLGGYVWPDIYNITLTVTDLLGATGVDVIQVEVLDCTGMPEVEAFCGCGSSGVWYTSTGGRQWVNRGGGTLDDVAIYDLSASPYTFGMLLHKVWAATENGLYLTEDSGLTWREIEDFPTDMTPRAVRASPYSEEEVYVLAQDTAGAAFLLRSEDEGETWTELRISQIYLEYQGIMGLGDDFLYGTKFDLPAGAAADSARCITINSTYSRNPATGEWEELVGGDLDHNLSTFVDVQTLIAGDEGALFWSAGVWDDYDGLTGSAAGRFVDCFRKIPTDHILLKDDELWELTTPGGGVPFSHVGSSPWTLPQSGARFIIRIDGTSNLLIGYAHEIVRCEIGGFPVNATFFTEWADPNVTLGAPFFLDTSVGGTYWVAANETRLLVRDNIAQTWNWDTIECPYPITNSGTVRGNPPLGFPVVHVVTENGVYQRDAPNNRYFLIAEQENVERVFYNDGGAGMIFTMTSSDNYPGVYRIDTDTYRLPVGNLHHTMDINASGEFIYIAVIEIATGNPVILRVSYDLEATDVLYEPGGGTWGGVVASKSDVGGVWFFGDFGAATKILHSEDFGKTTTDITDAGWGANEVVAAVTPSLFDVRDAIAVLNDAQETYLTRDATDWIKTGDTAFVAACAERDPLEPFNLFLGREDELGPPLLQYSPNEGVGWLERSTGILPSSSITVIEVVG